MTEPAYVVDQATGAGGWSDVGQVELRKGDPVTVTLKPSANGTVVADGVRLVRDNAADTDTEAKAFAYSYDVNGNLTGINDTSSGARADDYQVTYTGLNQVASVKEALAGQETATTSYSYDVLGQPVTVDHPDQASTYEYQDPRHLLTQVSVDDLNDTAGPKATQYTYDNRGMRATETKANGNVVTNGYFLDGALKSLREEKSGGALVASHAYTYDDNGNKHTDVASKANADVAGAYLESTTTYSYDPAERLSESVKTGNGAKTETYVHDDNANVISQSVGGTATTYSYDRNRLLTATADSATASYRYDPFGRQTSVVSAGLTISRTTYDGFDHIAESEKMNDAGALESTTYAYDPLDRTASKTADGETTDYTYLGMSSEVLGEEVAGQLTKSYQYSPWGQRLSQITHQANPETDVEAGESAYYGYNSHTDVETLTDSAGDTVATYGYTAYGNADEAEYTGTDKPEVGTPEATEPYNAYRYNSKRWDAGTDTYDMGFRDYAPGLNRFTTRDMYNGALANMSLGSDPYTGNRYAFTAGNPISRVEMDGHDWLSETGDWLQEFGTSLADGAVGAVTGTVDWAYRWGSGFVGCLQEDDALCDRAVQAGDEASLSSQWDGLTNDVTGIVDGFGSGESAAASASAVLLVGDFASRRPKPASGPVEIKIPEWANWDQVLQFADYAQGANAAIAQGAVSPTGRVSTGSGPGSVRAQAEREARAERKRAEAAGSPYTGVAGHVPDAMWLGHGTPFQWHDQDKRVNSSLASIWQRYDVGYKPTSFELRLQYPVGIGQVSLP